jgi:two-component system LytT family response regulator
MLKAVIIDDEKLGRDSLNYLVESCCSDSVVVVALAEGVTDGLMAIHKHNPDIVFLDIQMKGETGFDLLSKLEQIKFSLIFTTAYDSYALKAIKFCAIDYLLKPIDVMELRSAVFKVKERTNPQVLNTQYETYITNHQTSIKEEKKLGISTDNGVIIFHITDILYCKASSSNTIIYLKEKKEPLVSTKNLKEYEDILLEFNFFRIHNSYLINLSEVKNFLKEKKGGEGGLVIMNNDTQLEVSKRKRAAFLTALVK